MQPAVTAAEWTEFRDPSGKPYWYNIKTDQTVWQRPGSIKVHPPKPNAPKTPSTPSTSSTARAASPKALTPRPPANAPTASATTTPARSLSPPASPTSSGFVRMSTAQPILVSPPPSSPSNSSSVGAASLGRSSVASPPVSPSKGPPPLPSQREKAEKAAAAAAAAAAGGATSSAPSLNKAQSALPALSVSTSTAATPPPASPLSPSKQRLPEGWSVFQTPQGKEYYLNVHTGVTQWERPTAPAVGAATRAASPSVAVRQAATPSSSSSSLPSSSSSSSPSTVIPNLMANNTAAGVWWSSGTTLTTTKNGFLKLWTFKEKKWKPFYLIVAANNPTLSWYPSAEKYFFEGEVQPPVGTVVLTNSQCVMGKTIPGKKEIVVQIIPRVGGLENSVMVEFSKKIEAESWMDVFQDHGAILRQIVKEGELTKSDATVKTWNRRYFVLYDHQIVYFKKQTDEFPSGEIPLSGGSVVFRKSPEELHTTHKHLFVFQENSDEGRRKYPISAKDDAEREEWVTAIAQVISNKEKSVHKNSLLEGYLLKAKRKKTDEWHQRYFALFGDALLYFKQRDDKKEAGIIPLPGGLEIMVLRASRRTGLANTAVVDLTHIPESVASPDAPRLASATVSSPGSPRGGGGGVNESKSPTSPLKQRGAGGAAGHMQAVATAATQLAAKAEVKGDSLVLHLAQNGDEDSPVEYLKSISSAKPNDLSTWADAIKAVVSQKNPNVKPASIREGYLFIAKQAKQKKYNIKYCALYTDRIQMFKKKNDPLWEEEIVFQGGSSVETTTVPNQKHTFVINTSGDEGALKWYCGGRSRVDYLNWVKVLTVYTARLERKENAYSVQEGHLHYRTTTTAWRKVYTLLLPDQIQFFAKRRNASTAHAVADGVVLLPGGFEVEPVSFEDQKNAFLVAETGDEDAELHYFAAADPNLRGEWLIKLTQLLSKKSLQVHPRSFKESYLMRSWKTASSKKMEKKYFMLLTDGLFFHSHKRPTPSMGKPESILITSVTEVGLCEGKDSDAMFWVRESPDDDTPTLFLSVATKLGHVESGENNKQTMKTVQSWIKIISDLIATKPKKKLAESIREGYAYTSKGPSKKAYMVLLSNSLLCFRKRSEIKEESAIGIRGGTIVKTIEGSDGGFGLNIFESGDDGAAKIAIWCETEAERDGWTKSLNEILSTKSSKINPRSTREGYLLSKVGLLATFKKRYVVFLFLVEPQLHVYTSRDDDKAESIFIVSTHSRVVPEQEGVFTIKTVNDDGLDGPVVKFKASDDQELNAWLGVINEAIDQINVHAQPTSSSSGGQKQAELPNGGLSDMELADAQNRVRVTFDEIMEEAEWLALFKKFCAEQFEEENILFYIEVQTYVKEAESHPEAMLKRAMQIYDTFIRKDSRYELNLPSVMRNEINQKFNLEPGVLENELDGHDFDAISAEICKLIMTNSFLRFVKSKTFNTILAKRYRSLGYSTVDPESTVNSSTFMGLMDDDNKHDS